MVMNEVIKATSKQMELMIESYGKHVVASKVPHINGIISLEDCVITIYTTGSIVFQGKAAREHFLEWQSIFNESFRAHIGSDEVGTGDFFGPVVVCAAYVSTELEPTLLALGVGDSKTFTDQKIIQMAKQMLPLVVHRQIVLMPEYYNKLYAKHPNLNHIKALLHNRAIIELLAQTGKKPVVMDQFVHPKKYFEYLDHQKTVHKEIEFHTKAESKFVAVAVASILARYYFLESWKLLERRAGQTLPKGAGSQVDQAASLLLDNITEEQLGQYAKLHFKNMKKIQPVH
jgi:ribonuclease HIII